MSKKLPFVKSDIPRDLRMFLDRVRELVSGAGADRLISVDDLTSAGIAGTNNSGGLTLPNTGTGTGTGTSSAGTPPAPRNLAATAAIRNIIVTWDAPGYPGHAYAEVWGASTNLLSAAVLLGMSPGGIYVDETGPSTTRYYWVRFVNTSNVKGPFSGTNGVVATTGPEVAYLLDLLASAITSSELSAALNARIDLIDGPESDPESVNARVKAETEARITAVSTETNARAIADGILNSAITSEAGSRANADSITNSALQTTRQTTSILNNALATEENLRAAVDALLATADTNAANNLAVTRAAVISEQNTRMSADSALASSITAVVASAANNSAAIITEQQARVNNDDALALQISLVSAGVGEQFDYDEIWYFDSGLDGWTGNGTPTNVSGWLRPANQASDPYVISPTGLGVDAVKWTQARLRIRKYGTPTWDGYLYWKGVADTTWDNARRVALTEPTYDANDIGLVSVTINWQSAGTVDSIRIDLSTAQTATDYFIIDWAAIGRPSPGASTAALLEEQEARADADDAEALARTTLSTNLVGAGYVPGQTLAQLTSGLIFEERTARSTQDGAFVTSISNLTATVAGKNGIYRQNTAPLTPSVNDIWVDTSISFADEEYFEGAYSAVKHKQYQWDGLAWLDITDNDIFDTQASITVEQLARASADESLSQQITTLTATQTFTSAALVVEQTTRATADSATASQVTSLAAQSLDNSAAIVVEQTTRSTATEALASQNLALRADSADNAAAIILEQTARTTADSATATQVAGLAATTGTNAAAIATEQEARTTADSAAASQTQTISAATADNSAAILVEQEARTTGDTAVSSQTSSLLARTADNAALIFTEQTARTAADVVTASQVNGLSATTSNAFSAVQSEAVTRSTQDTALASSITTLSSQVNDPTTGLPATRADLTTNYFTQTDTENAIAQSATYLRAYAGIQSKVFRQADTPLKRGVDPETSDDVALEAGDVWYDTNDGNKLYLWSGTEWEYSPDADITGAVDDVDARVTTVENTKIGYCTIGGLATDDTNKADCEAAGGTWNVGIPIATAVKQVSVSDGVDTATLEQRFTAQSTLNDGLKALYTIKLDVDGNVAGYGIYGDAGSSEFIANVGRFAVTTPQSLIPVRTNSATYAVGAIARIVGADSKTLVCKTSGTTGSTVPAIGAVGTKVVDGDVVWQVASRVPFAVQAVPDQINGQDVPAGVYIDAAYILNATIQSAQIADLGIDDTKIANLTVGKLRAGSLDADQYIQSTNYGTSGGAQGFRLDANGNAYLQNAVVRGTVYATDGQFNGEVIAEDTGGNKARMWAGNFEIYKVVPSVGVVLYKALSRVESGVGANNVQVNIPGYFTAQPRVIVSPANIALYEKNYASQSQSIQCEARDLVETSAGSMSWRFTPLATLSLAANTGQTVVNQTSGSISTGWTSSSYTTPANTASITPNITLTSLRGTGTSGGYYLRTVRWKVEYLSGGTWVAGSWTTSALGAAAPATITTGTTFTFPSSGTWVFRIVTEAYDSGGTFSVGTSYETATDNISRTGDVNVYVGPYQTADLTLTYTPTYSAPSGWEVTNVSYNYVYSYSISKSSGIGTFGATISGSGLYFFAQENNPKSGSSLTQTYSRSSNLLVFSVSASWDSFFQRSGYASLTLHSVTGVVSRRRPLTNSTTASNTFSFNYYDYNLTAAQVLATGSLNWIAIGE